MLQHYRHNLKSSMTDSEKIYSKFMMLPMIFRWGRSQSVVRHFARPQTLHSNS